jgi:hypothetical protein
MALQRLGWPGRRVVVNSVTVEIVWISAFFDLLLFNLVALGLVAMAPIFKGVSPVGLAIGVFAVCT